MLKRNLAITITAALLSVAGAAQAATPATTPSSGSNSGISANTTSPATAARMNDMDHVFPSSALEGGERDERQAAYTTLDKVKRGPVQDHGGVFPSSAID